MRELESIIAAYDKATSDGLDCALATVVHVEGSAYRKAGARMLVDENGLMTGAISGGCLEGDALHKALHALHQGQNKLISYDTSDEDDAVIGAQLGCNGVIQVLFEPIDKADEQNPIELIKELIATKSRKVIVTLFNLNKRLEQLGTKLIFDESLETSQSLPNQELMTQIRRDSQKVLNQHYPHFGEYLQQDDSWHAFIEHYQSPISLVLVGAGNDAQILVSIADVLGWDVVVTDGRPTHANSERFINSCQVIVTKPERFLESVIIDRRTVFVLMSHNYNYDLAVLKLLLDFPQIPYIGILGPKKKYERMVSDLSDQSIRLSEHQTERIHAPVGLNLGAETPAEIALSILAEIQAKMTKSNGLSLREKDGRIHDKTFENFIKTEI